MLAALIVLAVAALQASPAAISSGPPAPDCQTLMVVEPTGDIATLCAGEAAMRRAANAAAGSPERIQHLREAAAQYSRAAELLKNLELKIYAYEAVVRVHDASNLNEPAVVEPALRQLARFLDENGAVTDARLSRPIPMLDTAALEAVKQWRFQPTIIDGRAVPTRLTVTVNFTLQKK